MRASPIPPPVTYKVSRQLRLPDSSGYWCLLPPFLLPLPTHCGPFTLHMAQSCSLWAPCRGVSPRLASGSQISVSISRAQIDHSAPQAQLSLEGVMACFSPNLLRSRLPW